MTVYNVHTPAPVDACEELQNHAGVHGVDSETSAFSPSVPRVALGGGSCGSLLGGRRGGRVSQRRHQGSVDGYVVLPLLNRINQTQTRVRAEPCSATM